MGTLPTNALPRNGRTTSAAVVGAGIAGLTCARALNDHGFEVTVYDKARGPGGRVSTRRIEPDLSFDHGAPYFTARTSRFAKLVEAMKVRGCVAEWGVRIVKIVNSTVSDTGPQTRFVGVPGMSAVGAYLAADLAICREVQIVQIKRADGLWELTDDTGRRIGPFAFLVLSLPAPQSAVLLEPHRIAAEVAGVAMAPCWAALVAFQDQLELPWDGAFVSDSPLSWLARNSSKPGRPRGADCWVLHASPEWSASFLEESPDVVGSQLHDAFVATVGRSLPKVEYLTAHRWRYSSGAVPSGRAVLFDAEAGLAVCGDWLSSGGIEGAFLSGIAAAQCVLNEVGIPLFQAST